MLKKRKILSIDVSQGVYAEFVNAIVDLAKSKKSSYVCVANVHMLVEAHHSRSFQQIVNGADITTPDGMPIAKSFETLYGIEQERVDGMSLLPILLEKAVEADLAVYFYGGSVDMIAHAGEFIKANYPLLNVAGMYSPPFRSLTEEEDQVVINNIKKSGANIVFVALGCPKQERWMSEMKGRIPAVMVGVGGALPVLIGVQKRAPQWMQKNSLEWLYRFMQEPRRLFKRYMVTNTTFLYLLAREKLQSKRKMSVPVPK